MDESNELLARRAARAEQAQRLQREIEELLSRADRASDEKNYLEASEIYVYAVGDYWPQPILTTRLAACYNALGRYFEAEEIATYALEYDPRSIEARYNRAMSRKGLSWFNAALKDLESILEQSPGNKEAEAEMENIFAAMMDDEGFNMLDKEEEEHPRYTQSGWDLPDSESDSEDAHHQVNAAPCKSYNNGELHLTSECPFSHAPDSASSRDEMGRNVCNEFIIGGCAKGETCAYSHSKVHLPANGWWNDPEALAQASEIKKKLHQGYYGRGKRPALLKNPKGSPYVARDLAEETTEYIQESFERVEDINHKANIRAPPDEPFILFVSRLMYDPYGASVLEKEIFLQCGFQTTVVLLEKSDDLSTPFITAEFLECPNLIGVVLADDVIMSRRNQYCARQLVNFVKKGGSLVIVFDGGGCNSFDRHMKNFWDLDWTLGEYRSNTFFLNSSGNELAQGNPSLPGKYAMKAMQVAGIRPEQAVYMQTAESTHPLPEGAAGMQAPIAYGRVGRGFLGYVGDVNREKESHLTIMAMFGLLDRPGGIDNSTGGLRVRPGR